MGDRIVACHQPNFLPWLGFFAKMARADVFVLLDDVQFTQGTNKHNWTTRVKILATNGPAWLSIPVVRAGQGKQQIRDLRSDLNDSRWIAKMLRTLDESYRKAPYANTVLPPILDIIRRHSGWICETNIELIESIATTLGIDSHRTCSSACSAEGVATERLINLTRANGGSMYLSGDGADEYQLESRFCDAGIGFGKLGFRHPVYAQRRDATFTPGLSVVDALCYVGPQQTRALLDNPKSDA